MEQVYTMNTRLPEITSELDRVVGYNGLLTYAVEYNLLNYMWVTDDNTPKQIAVNVPDKCPLNIAAGFMLKILKDKQTESNKKPMS